MWFYFVKVFGDSAFGRCTLRIWMGVHKIWGFVLWLRRTVNFEAGADFPAVPKQGSTSFAAVELLDPC